VKKQIEGADHLVLQRRHAQATTIADGHRRSNFNRFRCRASPRIRRINIRFFPTGHWLIGMGHDRATSVHRRSATRSFRSREAVRDLPCANTT
jgi:hypothetical protein